MFIRERPNKLWVTDITEHPTREGKVYCAVVVDAFSRRASCSSVPSSLASITASIPPPAFTTRAAVSSWPVRRSARVNGRRGARCSSNQTA